MPPAGRSSWTSLIGAGLHARVARRAALLRDERHWTRSTASIQLRQLRGLLSRAAGTWFGRERGLARLVTLPEGELLAAYRAAVPVSDWYALRAPIQRMREGAEPDVLWPGLVQDFAQTSGTTAGDKYIPVSREMLRSNYRASLDIFANLSNYGESLPRLLGGKILFLGGSTALTTSDAGVRTGDLSGIVSRLIRWPISAVYSPGARIALMDHWPSKIDAMARACMAQDVRMISGMPSWALVLFQRMLDMAREEGRAVGGVREIWPGLRVFVHGGVKYAPFEPRVRALFSGDARGDDIPVRHELYPASEGFVAMQDARGEPGRQASLRLCSDIGLFFEFVPLEEIDRADARAAACWEVEKGQRYVVVLTTCAGLWRYVLGDVVEFDSVPAGPDGRGGEGPARLRIVGRHRHFINAFGENLIVEHIETAVARAAGESGVVVGEFTAAPVYPEAGRRGGLELAVEVEAGHGALETFARVFDDALKAQNVDYTTKRTSDLGMGPPTITTLRPGAFHRWMAARGKLGGQHKCPRCANGRELIDQVIAAGAEAGSGHPQESR